MPGCTTYGVATDYGATFNRLAKSAHAENHGARRLERLGFSEVMEPEPSTVRAGARLSATRCRSTPPPIAAGSDVGLGVAPTAATGHRDEVAAKLHLLATTDLMTSTPAHHPMPYIARAVVAAGPYMPEVRPAATVDPPCPSFAPALPDPMVEGMVTAGDVIVAVAVRSHACLPHALDVMGHAEVVHLVVNQTAGRRPPLPRLHPVAHVLQLLTVAGAPQWMCSARRAGL